MTDQPPPPDGSPRGFSLRRWSQRKLEAARASPAPSPPATPTVPSANSPSTAEPSPMQPTPSAEPLPPVESLTFDSDFVAFLKPDVDEFVKRAALRQLFRDPRFNIMDGLDTYIDDYTKPDPISADMLKQLMHGRYVFDPPKTELTADGHVVDVPPEQSAEAIAEGDAHLGPLDDTTSIESNRTGDSVER